MITFHSHTPLLGMYFVFDMLYDIDHVLYYLQKSHALSAKWAQDLRSIEVRRCFPRETK